MLSAHMLHRLALGFMALAGLAVSPAVGQNTYDWSGEGANTEFSNPDNWWGGVPPVDSEYADRLIFEVGEPTANNNLTNLGAQVIDFYEGGFTLTGNAISDINQINFVYTGTGVNTFQMALNSAANSRFIFNMPNFLGEVQLFEFYNAVTSVGGSMVSAFGYSPYNNGLIFLGSNGTLEATDPSAVQLAQITLDLDNSEGINTQRLSTNYTVEMLNQSRLRLIGSGSATEALVQEVSAVRTIGSEILEVINNESAHGTVLQVNALELGEASLVLNHSTGEAGEVLGSVNGPQIHYAGTGSSAFLGPQQFYLSGDLESGEGTQFYEYAAYDPTRGVISASTGTNTLNVVTGSTRNILQTEDVLDFDTNREVNSLSFSGSNLVGTGTLGLTHLLISQPATGVWIGLDFGGRAGSISVENWDNAYNQIYAIIGGTITGSNSLAFRGDGDLTVAAANSFSGTVQILGTSLTLQQDGQFAEAGAFVLGTADKPSTLALQGGGVDRIADDAPITIAGEADVNVFANDVTYNERIGAVTVTAVGADPDYFFASIRVNTFGGEDAPVTLTMASLAFASSSSNAVVQLNTGNTGDRIVIEGGPIVLEHGNSLSIGLAYYGQEGTNITLEGGVMIAADAEGAVYLSSGTTSTLTADLNLQGGELGMLSDHGLLTLEGDLTMGEMLTTILDLGNPNVISSLIAIEGDLTLDGTLRVSQPFGFVEGSWLLFSYTGILTDLGWNIDGTDGGYVLFIDETNKQVFLNAVPEPGTAILLGFGVLAAGARRVRSRRLA